MRLNSNAKIGRRIENGIEHRIDWFPNLFSAIMNRNLAKLRRKGFDFRNVDTHKLINYAKTVEYRYNNMWGNYKWKKTKV